MHLKHISVKPKVNPDDIWDVNEVQTSVFNDVADSRPQPE